MYSKILFRQIVFNIASCFSGADWTAAFIFSGSGVDDRFPDVSFAAFPPDALMAARRDHVRRKATIVLSIPFRSEIRKESKQVIFTGNGSLTAANRASAAAHLA